MDAVLHCSCPASPGHDDKVISSVGLTYLAEGAAHIVYRISLPGTAAETHPHLVGKLFRFRKSIPSAVPCAQTVANFQNRIAPLFPENSLVDLKLHQLPDQYAITTKLNAALEQREAKGSRPAPRREVYLAPSAEEPNHILVTDMSPKTTDERLAEFKPKWLVQSSSAPSGARRCRTCALREMRTEDERRTGNRHTGRGHADFCPLDLLSDDDDVLEEVVRLTSLTDAFPRSFVACYKEQLQPLLRRLRDLQADHNNVSLENFESDERHDFSVPMALRDCSVFVKSRIGEMGFQEVRLADLDLKTSEGGKLARWAGMERRLIEGGWYTGTEDAESRGQRLCRALE
jgi:inositol-pentakisphosphate 2-kinase